MLLQQSAKNQKQKQLQNKKIQACASTFFLFLFKQKLSRMIRGMSLRHLAREIVIQALFTWDFKGKRVEHTDEWFAFPHELKPQVRDVDFPQELYSGVLKKVNVIDEIIEKAAPQWPLDRIAPVDRNILRLGIYEMLFSDREDVPPRVAINEAIELAKSYGGPNSYKFISGVLGSIYEASDLKANDVQPKKKDPSEYPLAVKAGAVIFSVDKEGERHFAFVHDIFGKWTLSKGGIKEGEDPKVGVLREIKDEIGLDCEVMKELGSNEYLANDKVHGKIRKQVHYFLLKAEHTPIKLQEEGGGLVETAWFKQSEIAGLTTYDDIQKIINDGIKASENY